MMRFLGLSGVLALVLTVSGCLCGRGGPAPGCKAVGAECTTHGECCSFGCIGGVCTANPTEGGICATSADCASGLFCENQSCVSGCRQAQDACRSDYACCSGICDIPAGQSEGVCGARAGCGEAGAGCATSNDCCSGLQCPSGSCIPGTCKSATETCTVSGDCCAGLGCLNGVTCQTGCRYNGDACGGDNDCCSGYECRGGTCYSTDSCGTDWNTCDSSADCCADYRCGADKYCRKGRLGESCTDVSQCGSGLICDQGICHYPATSCGTSAWSQCAIDADCCTSLSAGAGSAACELPADGGIVGTCCLPDGKTCSQSSGMDCCDSSVCLSTTGQCAACLDAGTATTDYRDCCSARRNTTFGTCCNDLPSTCTGDSQCCTGACGSDGNCCTKTNSYCTGAEGTRGTCCPGAICQSNYCRMGVGEACTAGTTYCVSGTVCFNGSCCQDVGLACDGASDCCSGVCGGDGKCAAAPPGGTCRVVNDCGGDAQNTCSGNTCCRDLAAPCTTVNDCCGGVTGLACQVVPTTGVQQCCIQSGNNSSSAAACCSGQITGAGKCQ